MDTVTPTQQRPQMADAPYAVPCLEMGPTRGAHSTLSHTDLAYSLHNQKDRPGAKGPSVMAERGWQEPIRSDVKGFSRGHARVSLLMTSPQVFPQAH